MVAGDDMLRQILEAHHDPVEMAVLIDAPLPVAVAEVFSLLTGQPDRLQPVAERLCVTTDRLLAAVRHYVREALLYPEADDARMLGMTPWSGPDDLKQQYRALQSWLHPDREGAPEDASALSARINAAWSRLRAIGRDAQGDDELIQFRPRWRKVEVPAERSPRRWVPILATATVMVIVGSAVLLGAHPDEKQTPWLAEPDQDAAIVVHSDAGPIAVPTSEPFRPVLPAEPIHPAADTHVGEGARPDELAQISAQEPVGVASSGAAATIAEHAAATAASDDIQPALTSAAPPASIPQPSLPVAQPEVASPVIAATEHVVAPATEPVAVRDTAPTPATTLNVTASPVARTAPPVPIDAPVAIAKTPDVQPDTPTSQVSLLETVEANALSPSSEPLAALAQNGATQSADVAPPSVPPAVTMIDTVRIDRAREQGASLLDYLTRRKPNVPPIWHSGSALDQAEQARQMLTAGRSVRPARPLHDLSRWHFDAHLAEARIPVEPSDHRLETQVVHVRMLWKHEDWWVENIDLETAK